MQTVVTRLKSLTTLALLAIVAALALAACTGADEDKPTITLIEGNWSSQRIMTEISSQVIANQLGYETEKLLTDITPGWAAICNGDADAAVEAWLPSRLPEIQPFIDQDCLELGGTNFPGTIGWFVPAYVVEGPDAPAPNLKSITDLNDYWELFENPENPGKGELIGGEIGWIDQPQDISRIMGYDLNYYRSNQGEAIILTRIKSAALTEEPLLTYLWTPHSIFGEVDLVQLEEPDTYVEGECFVEEGVPYRCPHPAFDVRTALRPELAESAPDVYNFISNMNFGEQTVSELMYEVDVAGREVVDVATEWIENNQAAIDSWVAGG
jgi:glycine betaine/proline transport system substrate-binding protein